MNHPIYEEILETLDRNLEIKQIQIGSSWIATELDNGACGISAKLFDRPNMPPSEMIEKYRKAYLLANEIIQNDPYVATLALSAANACHNTKERVYSYHAAVDPNISCAHGLDLKNKTVSIIGHMPRTKKQILEEFQPKTVYMFDMDSSKGDLSPNLESSLLPKSDVVIITGTTLINHTIADILQWSKDAIHIMIGPSVPFVPEMHSVQQTSGMIIEDKNHFLSWNQSNSGSPLPYCIAFLLKVPFTGE